MKKILTSGAVILSSLILIASLKGQSYISGPQSGVLSAGVYIVEDDIWVEVGDSLVIEGGAEFHFPLWAGFDIYGYLYACGNDEDSIKFIPFSPDTAWEGLNFFDSADDQSLLGYCQILDGMAAGPMPEGWGGGLLINDGHPTISNCTIAECEAVVGGGVCLFNSNSLFRDCSIINNVAYLQSYSPMGGGVYCLGCEASFVNCTISGNFCAWVGGGVYSFISNLTFLDCIISDNRAGWTAFSGGGGIYANYSDIFADHTLIAENSGTLGGGIYSYYSGLIISNCVFSANSSGINLPQGGCIRLFSSVGTIFNNIFCNNTGNSAIYLSNAQHSIFINYNDFYNNQPRNFSGVIHQPWGIISLTNFNGDSCDCFYNIFLDPLFQATGGDSAFRLTENSPCIDAGDPASPLDPDSTLADLGIYYFHQNLTVETDEPASPYAFNLFPPFPNPFNSEVNITFNLAISARLKIAVFDIQGRLVEILADKLMPSGFNQIIWRPQTQSSGIYFLIFETENGSVCQKLLFLK